MGYFSELNVLIIFSTYFFSIKRNETEFIQYRFPVDGGPSSKTWPRCPPHCVQTTSVRLIKRLLSGFTTTASGATGAEKFGHPLPESNFVSEENNRFPHPAQTYVPSAVWWTYFPLNGGSVPFFRSTLNSSGVRIFFHSSSDFFTFIFSTEITD